MENCVFYSLLLVLDMKCVCNKIEEMTAVGGLFVHMTIWGDYSTYSWNEYMIVPMSLFLCVMK